ncbi:MAG: hypothetical protein QOF35_19 [Actinomycetota bacterium]|nr:hypothetical protein [Actinomycetota bacterium]
MAQKVTLEFVDDVDGRTADETVAFGLDGLTYEIDLSTANAHKLRDALRPWIDHGRRIGGRARPGSKSKPSTDAADIRRWAQEKGWTIPQRGRIAAEIIQAYTNAH